MRILHAEFPEISFLRMSSFKEVEAPNLFAPETPLAVIIDETKIEELHGAIGRYREKHGPFTVALAYRNLCLARKLLGQADNADSIADLRFLPMNIQFDRWLSVFRLVLSGDGFLPYELLSASLIAHADNMPAAVSADPSGMSDVDLTAREREVLTLVAEGKQNKIIAEDLNLSVHTVKLHIHHLITKLGVHNRTEAALRYSAMMQQSGDKGP
ncbi:helix-turn-helix transcriptional regulator [Sulfitobacter sabulilitoris]|nr:response regulator transcription factor [Sulfitobacter sabulilitoris]